MAEDVLVVLVSCPPDKAAAMAELLVSESHAACDLAPTLSTLAWAPQWPLARGLESLQAWIAQELGRAG